MTGVSKRIGSIKFSCISPDEIRKMGSHRIITADTYDDDGFPIPLGLMDTHLGVIEPSLKCSTCGNKDKDCNGHFGHIDLAMPVIHVGYVKEIKKLLSSTCRSCGKLLLNEEEVKKFNEDIDEAEGIGGELEWRLKAKDTAKDASQTQICPHCGAERRKIALDKPTTFREDGHKLTPKEVRERLERIPDEDLRPLGIDAKSCRPEWMVLTALPVPPVTVRPSITLESGDRSEDDLTHKLVDVLRINQRLRENRDAGAPQLIVEDLWELLQYHVTTYFDNQTSGIPPARHRSGRPLKTLVQRLKGKEGRFRSNLSGKRVNFSARTVISPDPELSINEVGVPEEAARELTVPVQATADNIEILKEMVRRGPEPKGDHYMPGINSIDRVDGRTVRPKASNVDMMVEMIKPGAVVHRQLMDGDVVLFNRQPSLHRMSMMAHTVKVMPGRTFRLSLCVCPPYNADFDGDEMNLHVLQSEEARAEAIILMKVQEHILSPRFGGPVIGAIHDHITGCFLLTYNKEKAAYFTKEEMLNILTKVNVKSMPDPDHKASAKGREMYSGKAIFSTILPKDMNIHFKSSICRKCNQCKREDCEHDAYVKIRKGEVKMGTIDENAVGSFKGRILMKISRDHGPDAARSFLDNVTRIAIGAIMVKGFTTGIDDEDIPVDARTRIEDNLQESMDKVEKLVEAYRNNEMEQMPGRSMEETLEVQIMKVLGDARTDAGRIAGEKLGLENAAVIMAKSGARGSMLNLSQMAGAIGQQAVRGERLRRGYAGRTLPHFQQGDLGAKAKGFVTNCYKSGLTPTEFFFHSMGGREGLVDTAVRTSRSGYMQRRLINALEDLKLKDDTTVRNTADNIIQFRYGEDGIDPTRSVSGHAVDLDEIMEEILGEKEATLISKADDKSAGSYATVEKDEMEILGEEDEESTEDSIEPDSGGEE
jgi:DNA-directed RNA polymerase subunit A'